MSRSFSYLATPYSKFPGGIEAAFIAASKLAGRLLTASVNVYSPIAHTHPIAIYSGIDSYDHKVWMPFDELMMEAASQLLVAHLPGWATSYGIGLEIEIFKKAGKSIFDLDPDTLMMVKR